MFEFIKGFNAFLASFQFVYNNNMMKWYFLPIILWVILVFGLAISVSDDVELLLYHWLHDTWGFNIEVMSDKEQGWIFWLKAALSFSVAIIIKLLLWILLSRVMKYVILIIMAPLIAYLSEKTESILFGKEYDFDVKQMLIDTGKGIVISLRNFSIEMGLWLITFIVSVAVPILAIPALIFMFLVSAYFMGFTMFYYLAERQRLDIGSSIQILRKNKYTLLGLGTAYNLVSMIPIADWVVAPVNGAVGAVLAAKNTDIIRANKG
jgi:CysZ protein